MDKSEYHRYLASREWAMLKEMVKKRSGGRCERCLVGDHAGTHHLTYERVGNEDPEDIIGLCEDCHRYISGKSDFDPMAFYGSAALSLSGDVLEISNVLEYCKQNSLFLGEKQLAFELDTISSLFEVIKNRVRGSFIEKLASKCATGNFSSNGESSNRERAS